MRTIGATCLAGLIAIVIAGQNVDAHGFGSTASPSHYVADGMPHTYGTTEANISDRTAMESVFNDRIVNQYGIRTDLSVLQVTPTAYTDAYWYVTTATSTADATCMSLAATGVCESARIRFNTLWVRQQSLNEHRQGACHEIGHTVGFDDSVPEYQLGCMSGGGLGILSSHEIGHINAQYP